VTSEANETRWRVASASGGSTEIDDWELAAKLSNQELPSDSLVWKRGWAEWLPANRVGELQGGIKPADRRPVRQPRTQSPTLGAPPVPPQPARAAAAPATASPLPRVPAPRVMTPPTNEPVRVPMPTIAELEQAPATQTLRPPGAMPPPPRTVPTARFPRPKFQEGEAPPLEDSAAPVSPDSLSEATTQRKGASPSRADTIEQPPVAEHAPTQKEPAPKDALSTSKPAASKPAADLSETLAAGTDRPPLPALNATLPAESGAGLLGAPSRRRRAELLLLMLGLISLLLAATVVALLMRHKETDPNAPTATDSGVLPTPTPVACRLTRATKLLHPEVQLSVPILASDLLRTGRVALGLAATDKRAVGLTVDPATLDVAQAFALEPGAALVGVVPITQAGALSFAVDRADSALKFARTLDTKPSLTLGITDAGFSVMSPGGEPRVVWDRFAGDKLTAGKESITVPRVVSVPKVGHAVAFRRGGTDGAIYAGWIGSNGSKKGELVRVAAPGKLSGTPQVFAGPEDLVIAFANRNDPKEPWSIQLGRAPLGQLPVTTRGFAVAGAGTEGTLSPSLGSLSDGRWLLQWTERTATGYRVRVQTLTRELSPVGDPIETSSPDQSGGQGTVWANGTRALSLYVTSSAERKELWGAALSCE
jgi:hypothetical protein